MWSDVKHCRCHTSALHMRIFLAGWIPQCSKERLRGLHTVRNASYKSLTDMVLSEQDNRTLVTYRSKFICCYITSSHDEVNWNSTFSIQFVYPLSHDIVSLLVLHQTRKPICPFVTRLSSASETSTTSSPLAKL